MKGRGSHLGTYNDMCVCRAYGGLGKDARVGLDSAQPPLGLQHVQRSQGQGWRGQGFLSSDAESRWADDRTETE